MEIKEGRYYELANGSTVLMGKRDEEAFLVAEDMHYNQNGKCCYRGIDTGHYDELHSSRHVFREVSAPGFKMEFGRYYEDSTGAIIGPTYDWDYGSSVKSPFAIDFGSEERIYQGDGTNLYGWPNIIREVEAQKSPVSPSGEVDVNQFVADNLEVKGSNIENLTLKFEIDAEAVTEFIQTTEVKINALRDAFNMACDDISKYRGESVGFELKLEEATASLERTKAELEIVSEMKKTADWLLDEKRIRLTQKENDLNKATCEIVSAVVDLQFANARKKEYRARATRAEMAAAELRKEVARLNAKIDKDTLKKWIDFVKGLTIIGVIGFAGYAVSLL